MLNYRINLGISQVGSFILYFIKNLECEIIWIKKNIQVNNTLFIGTFLIINIQLVTFFYKLPELLHSLNQMLVLHIFLH